MLDLSSTESAYTLLAFGGSAAAMGLAALLSRKREGADSDWRTPLVIAAMLALAGAGSALAGLPSVFTTTPFLLCCVWVTIAVCRSAWPGRVVRLVRRPRV